MTDHPLRLVDLETSQKQGHERLRTDLTELEAEHKALTVRVTAIEQQLPTLERRATLLEQPVDVSKLRITPREVFGISVVCLTIASGMWVATSGLRSDVRDIITRMQAQADASKNRNDLSDERMANMQRAINEIKAQQTLQDIKINNLRELVLSNAKGLRLPQ